MSRYTRELRVLNVLAQLEPLELGGMTSTRVAELTGLKKARVDSALSNLHRKDEVSLYWADNRAQILWRPTVKGRDRLNESMDLDRQLSLRDYVWAILVLVPVLALAAAWTSR